MQYLRESLFSTAPPTAIDRQNESTVAVATVSPATTTRIFNVTMHRQPAMVMTRDYQVQTISKATSSNVQRGTHKRSKSTGTNSSEMDKYDRQMSSPSESYYSSVTDLSNGVVNPAYSGSVGNVHQNNPINMQVYREQYWTWSCQLRSWTRREKVLASVILFLVLVSFSLGAVIGVLFQKDGTFSFSQGGVLPIQPWLKNGPTENEEII